MGYPKVVYKRGTGKKVNDFGLYTAESALVQSEEALADLGPGWCGSPIEAAETNFAELQSERAEKLTKKVK